MKITEEMLFPLKKHAGNMTEILNAALESVDPDRATTQAINSLIQEFNFSKFSRLGLVSMGKAAIPMAQAALKILGDTIDSGIVVTKAIPDHMQKFGAKIKLFKGNHPIPGNGSLEAGKEIIQYLEEFNETDAVLFLISGGSSSLVTYPVNSVGLSDMVVTTRQLLECGASIDEINTVRKHLDGCKGGRLADYASPATCFSLILSDVIGNRMDMIASGPTVPDPTTFADAVDVLKKFHLLEKIPDAVLSYIKDGLDDNKMETPKPGNSVFSKNHASIIASLEQAMSAAKMRAAALGYEAEFYSPLLNGEARDCGVQLGEFLRKQSEASQPGGKPRCWIGGGETTVTIKGNGSGGRNQELALAAVDVLKGIPGATLISFATDGDDGQSPAAGAVVTDNTYQDAIAQGINPAEYLTNNDSYSFFSRMNLSITTGSTGTNVNDMVLLILD